MSDLVIQKSNEVFLKIEAEPHVYYELRDHFTFEVEGAKFMPQYRNKHWNGEIHLFCLLYTSPSPRDVEESRMPSSA